MNSKLYLAGIKSSLCMLLAFGQAAFIISTPVFAADNQVSIAGSPVFQINGPAAITADRVVKIQNNIDNSLIASSDHGPSAVKVTYVKGGPVISLGGYYIATVDNATAKAAGTTPSLLAQKWANALKSAMADKSSIDAYLAQLTGKESAIDTNSPASTYGNADSTSDSSKSQGTIAASDATSESTSMPSSDDMPAAAPSYTSGASPNSLQTAWQAMGTNSANQNVAQASANAENQSCYPASGQEPYQGRVAYIPAGMMIPVKLASSISSQAAKPGDIIMAKTTENITLANGVIPANSTLIGQVTVASGGARMGRSGNLGIKFNTLRMPNGVDTPISAHITSNIGKYADKGNDSFQGENEMSKVKKTLVATAIGAGGGAALGVAVGAVASGERGLGRGAWSGAAIGGGLGLAESLFLRKGSDVNLEQGQSMNLQLDAPVTTAMN